MATLPKEAAMNQTTIRKILKDTDFIHTSGTAEELKVAEYIKGLCEKAGMKAYLESFPVEMATIRKDSLKVFMNEADPGKEVPCKGFLLSGSGTVKAPLYYMPAQDPASIAKAKGKIVMIDGGMRHFIYQDLVKAGAVGFITYYGNVNFRDNDIDQTELRGFVRADAEKILGVNVNAKTAYEIVKSGAAFAEITIEQDEWMGESHNVIAEIPGQTDEWIVLSAHYDTVSLSRGSYDNMSGCIGVLYTLEEMLKGAPHRYGIKAVFCGSEERGLLGSKAYTNDHEAELEKVVLNINLDMIGSVMGKFISRVSAEEALATYIRYFGDEMGFPVEAKIGVYSSDSTPFADHGVPALSFARMAPPSQSSIHGRYDTIKLLSMERIADDSAFIAAFTRRMADSAFCPVRPEMPEKVKNDLDVYLNRKRPE